MPSIESRLEELLERAEELRRRGEFVSAEELCRDCPELVMLLRAKLDGEFGTRRPNDTGGSQKSPARADSGPARSDNIDDLHIGSEPIPGYRLVLRLGRGGYGEVWKAVAPGGFAVALKFVPLATEGLQVEQRALDIIRTLRHPCLLTTVGSWQTHRYLVIAMELADRTLKDRFQEAVRQGYIGVPREELLEYFHEAAKGLDFLNEPRHHYDGQERVSFQHRDIKPENILLVGSGAKVADFGLVRLLEQAQTSHTGSMTPIYAAPEFFEGHTSQHSDQYSLAITYCHLRGGRVPFVGSLADVMRGHLKESPDLSMLPPEERPIVGRALAKVPTQRWPNCITFIAELRNCLVKRGPTPVATDVGATYRPPAGSQVTPIPPPASRVPVSKSRPAKRRGLGLVVFCLAVIGAVVAVGMNDSAKDFFKDLLADKKGDDKKSEEKKESNRSVEKATQKASESTPAIVASTDKTPAANPVVPTSPSETSTVAGAATEKPSVEPPKTNPSPNSTTAKLEAPALLNPSAEPDSTPKVDTAKPAAPAVPVATTTPTPSTTPVPDPVPSPTKTADLIPPPTKSSEPPSVSSLPASPPTSNVPPTSTVPTPMPTPADQPTLKEAPLPEPRVVRKPDPKPEPKVIAAAPATPREPPAPLKAPFDDATAKGAQQAWATFLARPVVETNSIGLDLTLIPPGEFTIGMDTSDITRPPHAVPPQKVTIRSTFGIGTTEVTQAQWFQVMQSRPWSAHQVIRKDEHNIWYTVFLCRMCLFCRVD